ncbi:piercer of microtubule wall 2 protein-like isoform X1 [Rhopilema esculentum]|uniref:piercer of microtubule wall 2 protein-like isoform X1 n=1 Tax=Rhopilema esculentum TaxID=499914 RepID=UPI0031DF5B4F
MGTSMKSKELRQKLDREYQETLPGKGAKTSDFYKVNSIPSRFDNPDLDEKSQDQTPNNLGNPVFTCQLNSVAPVLTSKDMFDGYNRKESHPMYRTSGSDYGAVSPTVHTMPSSFHAKSQTFTENLGKCGMYRNNSLNTAVDKSRASSHHDGLF